MKKHNRVDDDSLAKKISTLELWQKQMAALQRASAPRNENLPTDQSNQITQAPLSRQSKTV